MFLVVTAEYFSDSGHRGKLMAVVFAQQGFGILCAALVSTSMLAAFRSSIDKNPNSLDYVWRLVLGFGAIPGLVALFFRLTISETPLYQLYIHNKRKQARENRQGTQNNQQEIDPDQENIHGISLTEFYRFFSKRGNRKYLKYLIGTAIAWFCVDISFYGIGLNNATILKEIGFDVSKTSAGAYTQLLNASIGNVFITMMGTIPGYLMTIALIDNKNVGRIRIMYIGFAMSAVLLLIFGCAYKEIVNNRAGFIAMFVLIQIGFSKLRDVGGKDPNNANEFLGPLIAITTIFMVIGLVVTYFCFDYNEDVREKLSKPLTDGNADDDSMENA
ncbi:5600_t:CDS:2 [Paraglomus occultum]|uniref:5600_t:CDS:1 n=1 Tax=Paraglomus occultum TaxID=144539 RepID=A0A9N9A9G6_9GLOM|nr:5600_t:CDS:2 [Paraglomus occultum]